MDNSILGIDELVEIGHEVGNGRGTGLMDLLEELQVSDAFLVVLDDIFIFDTGKLVVVFEESVGVVSETLVSAHGHLCKVVSVARAVVGCLVVRNEQL